jgi:hypothetical protein
VFVRWPKRVISWIYNTETRHLTAGIAKPKESSVARQHLGKHVSVETDTHATVVELVESMFPVLSEPKLYNGY